MAKKNEANRNNDCQDDPQRDGEYTHVRFARMTSAQLREHRARLLREIATASDKVQPKNPYQLAAYRQYRYSRWVGMVDEELDSRD
jgi:hypothetical protein